VIDNRGHLMHDDSSGILIIQTTEWFKVFNKNPEFMLHVDND
jgi:hypothetical protein